MGNLGLRCLIRTISPDIEGVFLIFRFDLIFLILDPQDDVYDRRLANHLVSLYFHGKEQQEEEHLVGVNISSKWTVFILDGLHA